MQIIYKWIISSFMIDLNKLIGFRKGVLVITGFDQSEYSKTNMKHVIANCHCDRCKRDIKIKLYLIYHRSDVNVYAHNCPECKEEYRIEQNIKRFQGVTHGVLKFLDVDHIEGKDIFVKCQCLRCGGITIVRSDRLSKRIPPKTCEHCIDEYNGKLTKERYYKLSGLTGKEYELDKKLRNKLSDLKQGAKDRKLKYELSNDKGRELLQKPCHYCGDLESMGIDRIDSSIGYTIENCVPCCKICNIMKNKFSYREFLIKIQKINKNLLENSTTIENTEKSGSE